MKTLLTTILLLFAVSLVTAQSSLDSSLVAYFPFNGNAIDETGNGYNGTVSGAILSTDRFNEADKAYNFVFNGFSSDKIQVSGTSGLNFSTGGFSLSAWIKFSGTAGSGNNYPIVSKHICGEQSGYILMLFNGKLTFWLASSSGYNVLSTTEDYTDNSWHHVVAVYDDATQYIYVDGVLKNSIAFDYSVYNSANWALGGYNGCNGGFNGKVDEVKIYNRPLSAVEISEDYNLTRNSFIAYFPFNGNANDVTGNGYNGTINGNAALVPDRFSSQNKAYTFPDQSSSISLANSTNINLENGFTINAWIKYKSGGTKIIVCKHVCGFVNGFLFAIDTDGQIQLWLGQNGWSTVRTNQTFIEDQWYMVTATYDATSNIGKVYVDGEVGGTGSVVYTNFSANPISIGESYQNNCVAGNMDGSVDEVKIYSCPLSAAEILDEYNNSYNDLVLFLPFNGNPNDASGNSNNGINYAGVFSKDRYGNDNASMFFNAIDSYVEGINPGNNLPVGNSPRSFSAWIKNYQYNQWGSNIFHYGTAQPAPTNFHFLLTDVLGLGNGYGYGVVYGNTNLIDSTWHFVTGVYEGGTERTTKLYIDGKLDVTGTITTEPNTVLTNNWRIGRFMEGSSNFKGNIDELKIYNLALTDQQIWDMYKATTTAPTLLFPLDDSTLINPIMLNLVLDWDSLVTATGYRFLLANDSLFNTVIHDTLVNTSSFNFYDWFAVNIDNLYWKVRTINDGGIGPWSETNYFNIILTDIKNENQLPTEFALMQNYPNPFNPSTTITYHLPKTANVELKVYDIIGNEIATLVNEEKSAGVFEVQFNVTQDTRPAMSSGVYFYKLTAGDFVQTKKMILIK